MTRFQVRCVGCTYHLEHYINVPCSTTDKKYVKAAFPACMGKIFLLTLCKHQVSYGDADRAGEGQVNTAHLTQIQQVYGFFFSLFFLCEIYIRRVSITVNLCKEVEFWRQK